MSQDYADRTSPSVNKDGPGDDHDDAAFRHQYQRPNYMTVGNGSTSEAANKLAYDLNSDSGYGSSIPEGAQSATDWMHRDMNTDQMASSLTPTGRVHAESDRRTMAAHVHQLYYNHNRTALGRAITRTVELLRTLQDYNREWPAHYPSMQPPANAHQSSDPRPGLRHTQTTIDVTNTKHPSRPHGPARADTVVRESPSESAESSSAASNRPAPEPRLVTEQLARDFSVLKIDLKMDGLPQTEIIHSLRKDSKALAQLLDGQIQKSLRHLGALRERIEDTSSKVLITGDLNAGKSTFCNALLRRKVLPEDEQPCTSIFCEVLDVRENAGVEEVHAIPIGSKYDRNDERTYDVFPLDKLEDIVVDNSHYEQCKVYIKDIRTVDESLLNNGVLDIALIDAPGLNNDSLKTTAIFARQEEIDVVVFVVSAANHFTLSAREFIYDAAREKAYMFMVVNGFDLIKNKRRCQEQILKQVAHLSPATFKESSELVHFVSSDAIPVAPHSSDPRIGSGGASSSGKRPAGNPGDDDDDAYNDDESEGKHGEPGVPADKGKGKEKEKIQDFEELESSLRRFVLEKRARSKLAPAKTYLENVLDDLQSLANVNQDVAQNELDRVTKELKEIEPMLDHSKSSRSQASEEMDTTTEGAASDVYSHTRETLNGTINDVSQRELGVEYPGFLDVYTYADQITQAMVREITEAVGLCEEYARGKTAEGVNSIKSLGLLHLGDDFVDLNFHPDKMFKKKKDAIARHIDIEVEWWDFFDVVNLWERQEKVAGTSMAVTVAGLVGSRAIGGMGWLDGVLGAAKVVGSNNLRRLLVPGTLLAVALAISYAVASIPQTLPRRLSAKLSHQLAALDFTHANALRISSEVRKALKIPADNLRVGLQRNLEQLQTRKEEVSKVRGESEVARKYFGNLIRDSSEIKNSVDRIELEAPVQVAGGGFDY